MATLRDVPLRVRVKGALEVLRTDAGLDVEARYAVVAAAIWPQDVATPPVEVRAQRRWPVEVRSAVVAAYLAGGASYGVVGRRYGVPARTVKTWVMRAG